MAGIPLDQRDGFIWFDGRLVPWQDAKVHVLTHGLHYASSVFEGERAYNGKIFKLREHTERLIRSAAILEMEVPYTAQQLDDATNEVLRANKLTDCYIRPVVWRGSESLGLAVGDTKVHVAIAAWVWPSYFSEEMKQNGLKLCYGNWKRPAPETAPTASKAAGLYMICTLAKENAVRRGFHDALLLDYAGRVGEATAANFFMIKNGELHTPTTECVLNGITRLTVMDLARARQMKVVERAIMPAELRDADEIFVTGTAAEIVPIGQIEEMTFPIGPLTKLLSEDYQKLVRS